MARCKVKVALRIVNGMVDLDKSRRQLPKRIVYATFDSRRSNAAMQGTLFEETNSKEQRTLLMGGWMTDGR